MGFPGAVLSRAPTLCNPMDCSPPHSSVHGNSPGKNTGVGCHALLKGIFLTQGSNYSQILYHLSQQGSPFPGGSVCKQSTAKKEMQETWVQPLEEEMATHSSILAWKIPWAEEPGRL